VNTLVYALVHWRGGLHWCVREGRLAG